MSTAFSFFFYALLMEYCLLGRDAKPSSEFQLVGQIERTIWTRVNTLLSFDLKHFVLSLVVVFWAIVLAKCEQVLFQHSPGLSSLHCQISSENLFSPCWRKASTQHDAVITTIFHWVEGTLRVIRFLAHQLACTVSQNIYFFFHFQVIHHLMLGCYIW